MTIIRTTIGALFIGKARHRWEGKPPSAIDKHRVRAPVVLSETGFAGDEQADPNVHGGEEKAVHHYPADHYPVWQAELGERSIFKAGGFGENVSTQGLTEEDVCIGDIFRLDGAIVQVSQGRQPCWKLSAHTGVDRMAQLVQKTARAGWYYRVLQTGTVGPGGTFELCERPQPEWSVRRVALARFDPRLDRETALALAELKELNAGWRRAFLRKSEDETEDTDKRLIGPG